MSFINISPRYFFSSLLCRPRCPAAALQLHPLNFCCLLFSKFLPMQPAGEIREHKPQLDKRVTSFAFFSSLETISGGYNLWWYMIVTGTFQMTHFSVLKHFCPYILCIVASNEIEKEFWNQFFRESPPTPQVPKFVNLIRFSRNARRLISSQQMKLFSVDSFSVHLGLNWPLGTDKWRKNMCLANLRRPSPTYTFHTFH